MDRIQPVTDRHLQAPLRFGVIRQGQETFLLSRTFQPALAGTPEELLNTLADLIRSQLQERVWALPGLDDLLLAPRS